MRLPVLALAVAALLLSAAQSLATGPLGEAAKASGKPLVADFGMNLCKQCIKQSEAMERFKKEVGDRLGTRFVHVAKEAELTGAYKVMLVPTIIFFDAYGREVFRQVGYMDFEAMMEKTSELGLLGKR